MYMRVVVPAALAVALVVPAGQSQRAIIVTVLDQTGAPVKNVAPADLSVVEDGATREVVDVKPATDPMTIAILVDNTKPQQGKNAPTQEIRAALTSFVKIVQSASPESQIGLWEFAGAGIMTQKPTVKMEDVTKKISRHFPGQQPGGVLLEALTDASKELSKKGVGPRRIILSLSLSSPEVSTGDPRDVAMAMQKAGVNFWAVSVETGGGATPSRELILDNVTAASGGLRINVVTPIALEAQVKLIAEAITSQYLVTYTRPADAPAKVTDVRAVSKKGMKALTAPWMQ